MLSAEVIGLGFGSGFGGQILMNKQKLFSAAFGIALSLIAFVLFGTTVLAQSDKVEGLIKARNGDTMILQSSGSREVIVLLTESTEVKQKQGVFQARRKEMAMAALIPGLAVQVEGTYNDQKQLLAKSVTFKGNDLEQAEAIQAGMHETQKQAQQNQQELEKQNAELQKHNAELEKQSAALKEQKAAIDAAVARFGQLDDYYILDEVTVYFGNGKVDVDAKYNPQLLALAEKAKAINGYMIEVKGYASTVGSVALNQKLSEDRADNVTNILLQQAHIPLTRMLAPAAMGESHQVGDDKTAEGEAENRRVVVRVLQNKAIAGV
jgi:outer membrane protein OmpA-like peptidoglycan-associated protein